MVEHYAKERVLRKTSESRLYLNRTYWRFDSGLENCGGGDEL